MPTATYTYAWLTGSFIGPDVTDILAERGISAYVEVSPDGSLATITVDESIAEETVRAALPKDAVGIFRRITIRAPSDLATEVQFVTEDGVKVADFDAGSLVTIAGVAIRAFAQSPTVKGLVAFVVFDETETTFRQMQIKSNGEFTYEAMPIKFGEQQYYTLVDDTAEQAVIFDTIPAGYMGTTGRIHLRVYVLIKNNKGSAGTYTLTFYFDSKTVTIVSGANINNSASTRKVEVIDVEVVNAGATNAQNIIIRRSSLPDTAAANPQDFVYRGIWDTSAIDTTAAVDIKVNIDLSATDALFFAQSSGALDGPHKDPAA